MSRNARGACGAGGGWVCGGGGVGGWCEVCEEIMGGLGVRWLAPSCDRPRSEKETPSLFKCISTVPPFMFP